MRIKTLTAPKMADALAIIRQELGPEALILSTRKVTNAAGEQTLEITAAVNEPEPPSRAVEPLTTPLPATVLPTPRKAMAGAASAGQVPSLPEVLHQHGLPEHLIAKLATALPGLQSAGFSQAEALEMLLSKLVSFRGPTETLKPGHAHIFLGPPGAGKTTLIAKLAVQLHQGGRNAGLISLDDHKLGGFEALAITAETLGDTAHLISGAHTIKAAMHALGPRPVLLIDTPALTPYQPQAFAALKQRLDNLGIPAQAHLVIPADLNADDMAVLPIAAHRFNLQSLVATRLDCTTRYGALLGTAAAANLPLGLASHNGNVAAAPLTLTPQWLAQSLATLPRQPWEFTS